MAPNHKRCGPLSSNSPFLSKQASNHICLHWSGGVQRAIINQPFTGTTKECRHNQPEHLSGPDSFDMGNQPAKEQKGQEERKVQKDMYLVKVPPPVDPALARWLARDLAKMYGYAPKNPRAIEPPPHYVEFMRLYGWMDLDLDDPDLAHLFK